MLLAIRWEMLHTMLKKSDMFNHQLCHLTNREFLMDFVICTITSSHDIVFSFDLCKDVPKTLNKYIQPLNRIHLRAAQTLKTFVNVHIILLMKGMGGALRANKMCTARALLLVKERSEWFHEVLYSFANY
jgi:hypothetical protein